MRINEFSKHIFWSYNPDADLPNELIIWQVANYGELEDLIKLVRLFSINEILNALDRPNINEKRVNFLKRVLLKL